jgi:tryptophanyl-tRNA synthetase
LASFQKDHGGVPEICPIESIRRYHFEQDNYVAEQCSSGKLLCGDCKKYAIEQVTGWLSEHQKTLPEAGKKIEKFILTKPIKSILE